MAGHNVTDSNGYYEFAGLGDGEARLNLVGLPSGRQPTLPDWPVVTTNKANVRVNLGYYSGEFPNLPVKLSGRLSDDHILVVEAVNRTNQTATGGIVEVQTPVRVISRARAESVYYEPKRFVLQMKSILPGQTETAAYAFIPDYEVRAARELEADIRVIFTYEQQFMPQVIMIEPYPA